jgi:hypothetical protein
VQSIICRAPFFFPLITADFNQETCLRGSWGLSGNIDARIRRGETSRNDTLHGVRYLCLNEYSGDAMTRAHRCSPVSSALVIVWTCRTSNAYHHVSKIDEAAYRDLRLSLGFNRAVVPTRHWLGKPRIRARGRIFRCITLTRGAAVSFRSGNLRTLPPPPPRLGRCMGATAALPTQGCENCVNQHVVPVVDEANLFHSFTGTSDMRSRSHRVLLSQAQYGMCACAKEKPSLAFSSEWSTSQYSIQGCT